MGGCAPPDTEARLASFTELVATAIANTESRAALARLAEEQAALRRVATLVAHGVPPEEVFAAVAEEVGRLLPVDRASIGRYEPDGAATFVASWGRASELFPVGRRFSLGGHDFATLVSETGRSARIDNPADNATGPSPSPSARRASARRSGHRSSSRAACGAWLLRARAWSSRCRRTPRRGWPRSPSWSRRRSRTPTAAPS